MFYVFPLAWCLLLYLLSHEEKTLLALEKLKNWGASLYWGKEVIENRRALYSLVNDFYGTDFSNIRYGEVISLLKQIFHDYGEDISCSIDSLKQALEEDLSALCDSRHLLVESWAQMIMMLLMVNAMSFSVDYFSEVPPNFVEYLVLNTFLISPVLLFGPLQQILFKKCVGDLYQIRGKLWGVRAMAKTSICVSKVNSIIWPEDRGETLKISSQEIEERVLRAIHRWNEFGEDPTDRLELILSQLSLSMSSRFRRLKKLNEALKLSFLCIFYLIPYFVVFFYKITKIVGDIV